MIGDNGINNLPINVVITRGEKIELRRDEETVEWAQNLPVLNHTEEEVWHRGYAML
jgi:hypothetical protein